MIELYDPLATTPILILPEQREWLDVAYANFKKPWIPGDTTGAGQNLDIGYPRVYETTLDLLDGWRDVKLGDLNVMLDFTPSGGPAIIGLYRFFVDTLPLTNMCIRWVKMTGEQGLFREIAANLEEAGCWIMPWNEDDIDRIATEAGRAFDSAMVGGVDRVSAERARVREVIRLLAADRRDWLGTGRSPE